MQQQAYSGVDNLETMSEAENYNRYLLDLVRNHAGNGGRVLDFGAGGGQFAVPLSQLGFDVTALEPDELHRIRLDGRIAQCSASTSWRTGRSTACIRLNVLEHIEDDVAALRRLRKKLKTGGTVLIYVPACPLLYTSMDAKVGHVRRYTRRTLIAEGRAAGFGVERCAYVDSLGYFATLLFKVGDNDGGDINAVPCSCTTAPSSPSAGSSIASHVSGSAKTCC